MFAPALIILAGVAASEAYTGWSAYHNARFGFTMMTPPSYEVVARSDNGDGLSLKSGSDSLVVFGTHLTTNSFITEARHRMAAEQANGWKITYATFGKKSASFSGSRNQRIFYTRAIALCNEAAAFFTIEYHLYDIKILDDIIEDMVETLKPAEGCEP